MVVAASMSSSSVPSMSARSVSSSVPTALESTVWWGRQAGAHGLQGVQERGGLPVALAAEAVALGHQALHGEAGQLPQAPEVLEVGGEGAEAALGEEGAQAQLDPGGVAQRVVPLTAGGQ